MRHSRAPRAEGNKAAILIIHGIGQQQPYETLDAFARGIAGKLSPASEDLSHLLFELGDEKASAVRLRTTVPLGLARAQTLDIYEFYWAGLAQGRITLRQVLKWVARTSLTPLRAWSIQPTVLFREAGANRRKLFVFLRELFRSFLLVTVALAVVLPVVYAAREAPRIVEAGQQLIEVLRTSIPNGAAATVFVVWLLVVFVLFMLIGGWWRLFTAAKNNREILGTWHLTDQHGLRWWSWASVCAIVVLGVAGWFIPLLGGLALGQLGTGLLTAVGSPPVLSLTVAVVLVWLLRKPFVSYLGDVTLYVSSDERSEFFRFRQEVLKKSSALLGWLTIHAGYQSVYVAGHSLGSVIAYDTINKLITEGRAEKHTKNTTVLLDGLDRIHGLLTFGSPLDKIYYFFRREVGPSEAIRAQILSSLHGFRKKSSGREYGSLKLAPYDVPRLSNLLWYNVFSRADPVSGNLDFYEVDKQIARSYWHRMLSAHLAYWNDPRFYDVVFEWLTLEDRRSGPYESVRGEPDSRFARQVKEVDAPA